MIGRWTDSSRISPCTPSAPRATREHALIHAVFLLKYGARGGFGDDLRQIFRLRWRVTRRRIMLLSKAVSLGRPADRSILAPADGATAEAKRCDPRTNVVVTTAKNRPPVAARLLRLRLGLRSAARCSKDTFGLLKKPRADCVSKSASRESLGCDMGIAGEKADSLPHPEKLGGESSARPIEARRPVFCVPLNGKLALSSAWTQPPSPRPGRRSPGGHRDRSGPAHRSARKS